MIIAFSTSSPVASVALYSESGDLLDSRRGEAPRAASAACLNFLDEMLGPEADLSQVSGFLADLGPGSFTGVRVGVVLAKTMAYAVGARVAGAASPLLIDPHRRVVFPSKKGEWFIFDPSCEPVRQASLPDGDFTGFGPGIEPEVLPDAARFGAIWAQLDWMAPELLVPDYAIAPSISTPKQPFGVAGG